MSPVRRVYEPGRVIPGSRSLREFIDAIEPFPLEDRYRLVEQALALLEGAYVHLRLKRAMHAVDPVQRLRLLQRNLEELSDRQFHTELTTIFNSVRDLHTVYQLPDPYRGHVATLGFLVERYFTPARGEPRYVVSKVHEELKHEGFDVGARIVRWNAIPMHRAVRLNAERQAGSNVPARLARGLEAMTLRSLRSTLPPDEDWVMLEVDAPGRRGTFETRIHWRVVPADTLDGRPQDPVATLGTTLGIDAGNEATRQVKRRFFSSSEKAQRSAAQELRSVLRFERRTVLGRRVGYLRIFSFNVAAARRFVELVAEILRRLPQRGLILDIRGNPGGNILAAEGTLQLLSEEDVDPARFSLTTTALALGLCDANPDFRGWSPSIEAAVATGEAYSQALPISNPPELARDLPRYAGPVVLVTDAMSYSAADIFAAGFQDNFEDDPRRQILGTDARTGAGGANVWTHDLLRVWLPDLLEPLPQRAGFRVALRRTTRVGIQYQGLPLEDLGVQPDDVHLLTKVDITNGNRDLIRKATRMLRKPKAAPD